MKKEKKENFLVRNYRDSWRFFVKTKKHILFAAILFFLFAIIGFVFPIFFQEEIANFVKLLSAKAASLSWLGLIWFILLNNVRASILALVLGVLVGIFPVIMLITNGYVLGFVARHSVNHGGIFVLWKILPHGVFELPAIIMSAGIGIYLGTILFRKDRKFRKDFVDAIRFFIFVVVPLLIVAGIIEGTLIYLLR